MAKWFSSALSRWGFDGNGSMAVCQTQTPSDCWVMSSGIFCIGNPLVQSNSCRSHCWEELEGSGKCRVESELMFDRGTGVGWCQRVGWCRGSERRRHSGRTLGCSCGSKPSTSPRGDPQESPCVAPVLHRCCWGWRPTLGVCGGGCAGLGAHPQH